MDYKTYIDYEKRLESLLLNDLNNIYIFSFVLLLSEGVYGFFFIKIVFITSLIGMFFLMLSLLSYEARNGNTLQRLQEDYKNFENDNSFEKSISINSAIYTFCVLWNLIIIMVLYIINY